MSTFKTKLVLLLAISSLMVPSVISAAETEDMPIHTYKDGFVQTLVNGTYVPGNYVNVSEDTVAVYVPGGVGLIAVDTDAVLPEGSIVLE
jgi:archaellum component FlaG (FlaF/FlaG flagellin family)